MNRKLNIVLIVIWVSLMLFAILAPVDSLPKDIGFLSFIPCFDKFVHAGMFGGFAFLLFLLLEGKNKIQRALLTTFLFSISFGLLTEGLQLFLTEIIKRKFEWMDFLADIIGVVIALGLGYVIVYLNRKNKKVEE
ncbi:MAG: VanZ family protein [Bacteroidales bacterium]|jgi:VanZ family protein